MLRLFGRINLALLRLLILAIVIFTPALRADDDDEALAIKIMDTYVQEHVQKLEAGTKALMMSNPGANLQDFLQDYLKANDINGTSAVGNQIKESFNKSPKIKQLNQLVSSLKKAGVPVAKIGAAITSGETALAAAAANPVAANAAGAEQPLKKSDLRDAVRDLQEKANSTELAGFDFGVGMSLTMDVGSHNRVKSAELDANRKIRVKEEKNAIPRFILESHYFFTPNHDFLWMVRPDNWGWGPFVCVQPGDNIIDAVGAGLMLGFKREKTFGALVEPGSFNLGVGVIVDPNTQILGDGQREGQTLTETDSIRYKTTSQVGVVGVFSIVF